MEAGVYVSGGGRIRKLSLDSGGVLAQAPIDGCGAICAWNGAVYAAADTERVIYRLDDGLLPGGVYGGGPGMRTMCISPDGKRLYVLLADADSILMLDGHDGTPMFLARIGVNPQQIRLGEEARYLVAAGGGDGSVALLCANTLKTLLRLKEEGVCRDALYAANQVFALYLTPAFNSRMVIWSPGKSPRQISFPGEPGALLHTGKTLLVSAGRWLYVFDAQGQRLRCRYPFAQPASRMMKGGNGLLLLCPAEEILYRLNQNGLHMFADGSRDACME